MFVHAEMVANNFDRVETGIINKALFKFDLFVYAEMVANNFGRVEQGVYNRYNRTVDPVIVFF